MHLVICRNFIYGTDLIDLEKNNLEYNIISEIF